MQRVLGNPGFMKRIQNSFRSNTVVGRGLHSQSRSLSTRAKSPKDDDDMSWLASNSKEMRKIVGSAMIQEVSQGQAENMQKVVPWFIDTMPNSYFRQVRQEARTRHLKAITAMRDIGQEGMSIRMESTTEPTGSDLTIISNSGHDQTSLLEQIRTVKAPEGSQLSRLSMYTSSDDTLSLNVFSFNSLAAIEDLKASEEDGGPILDYLADLSKPTTMKKLETAMAGMEVNPALLEPASVKEYFTRCAPIYVQQSNPMHFAVQRHLYERVKGTHGTVISASPFSGEIPKKLEGRQAIWMSIASGGNIPPDVLLKVASNAVSKHGLEVFRAHIDTVDDDTRNGLPEHLAPAGASRDYVTQLRLLLSPGDPLEVLDDAALEDVARDIRRAKWYDDSVSALAQFSCETGKTDDMKLGMGNDRAEVILALATMLHGPLAKTDAGESFANAATIVELLRSQPSVWMGTAVQIADLFLDKFNPKKDLSSEEFDRRHDKLASKIDKLVAANAKGALNEMLRATKYTLRTNFYNNERYALSMRVDPRIMASGSIGESADSPLPFGVFFIKGRNFAGFHCRFRDIARGGLRIVTPGSEAQMNLESSRHFDEVYNLSLAQQLKNKDIPEGGSKGVVLVDAPSVGKERTPSTVRRSVKAFTDSLLDLIVEDSVKGLKDYLQKDELIYLGPDEQVIPEDIEWICYRAGQRGYPIPDAFMSSKARNGINHKVYGVTSEGVVVHLRTALEEHLGIDPKKEKFTVKVTGGPDGDVAGNFIKIMHREFPDTCKILGIADGFGVAEDPEGLDIGELMRLFESELPISHFDESKLSKDGLCMTTDTEEGVYRRNTMHFRIKSDAFVPAGGRPNTINIENWHNFLDEEGKPASPLIVEGANIFTTVEARQKLFEEGGVAIVKDSSANKCGVITSSDEIACSMLISEAEFLDVKEELVNDVLHRIRHLAELEARLLFREYNNYPGSLPHFSERISNAINNATDAIADALADVGPGDELFDKVQPVIRENLPAKLSEIAWDRVKDRFPLQYQRNAIASTLASRLVYKEGIHFIEAQSRSDLAGLAFKHYETEEYVDSLASRVEAGDAEAVADALKLLRKGGTRTALNIF